MTTGQRLRGPGVPRSFDRWSKAERTRRAIRSRQEGHTAHATSEEARACAREMLDVYERCVRACVRVCVCVARLTHTITHAEMLDVYERCVRACARARLSDSLLSAILWLMMAAHDAPF